MKEKVLSVFIDESGDFGQYNPASPNYYVAMVGMPENTGKLRKYTSNFEFNGGYYDYRLLRY